MHDQMLESNRDDVKLEAMRCVTVMTAKGKLSVPRTLFPHIVKNVSSKNLELKKLIYLYLTNFADQEPDLALLPVATLQKSLKSPNPLVRSSALKVLTSMRLNILSAILMATLRNSVNDLSPYVRKTVAHSIIKIYRLDPSLKPDLVEYVDRLFNDKNSMVLSSVVAAHEVVCPERLDLVQKHYRRFCFILADCNEWGQTLLLKLLVRYILKTCRPTKDDSTRGSADRDPKILLRSAKPLVHSNNSAVVMAVIKLFISIADHNEVRSTITRPLIRLLYSHREIQLVVLEMIENLTTLADGNLTSFDVESEDEEDLLPQEPTIASSTIDLKEETSELDAEPNSKGLATSIADSLKDIEGEEQQQLTRDGYIALDEDAEEQLHETLDNGVKVEGNNKPELKSDSNDEEAKESVSDDDDDESSEEGPSSEEDGESNEEDSEEDSEDDSEEDSEEDSEDEDVDDDDVAATTNDKIDSQTGAIKVDGDESDKDDDDKKDFDINYKDLSANKDPSAYREVFRPYIKSFFVKHTDCTQIRLAKLKILTNLSSSVNVTLILKELQAYIAIYVDDHEFVSASIHAIGRCAMIVKEVAHTCLNGLTNLLSNNNEHIVSEAIVVLRSQIINKKIKGLVEPMAANEAANKGESGANEDQQPVKKSQADSQADEDDKMVSAVIKQVTKLLPTVTAPQARATILWILAEFCDKNLTAAKCTPNVLRSVAKSFCEEDNFVKLQSLTLVSKFLLSLNKESKADLYDKVRLIASYLFSLAKYDINHDVRDRGRFLKKLLEDENICARVLNGIEKDHARPEVAA